jgi:hypothetical protein
VVRTEFGVGYVNQEFKDDEAEMREIQTGQGWPTVKQDQIVQE